MARFYAGIQGHRGQATRLGTAKSGLNAFVNGWHGGVSVRLYTNRDDEDCAAVCLTGGSSGGAELCLYDGPINHAARVAMEMARAAASVSKD